MRKSDVLAYYENNQSAAGRAIGVTRATVNNWPDVVPLEPARAYEIVTLGILKVQETLYPRLKLAHDAVASASRRRPGISVRA